MATHYIVCTSQHRFGSNSNWTGGECWEAGLVLAAMMYLEDSPTNDSFFFFPCVPCFYMSFPMVSPIVYNIFHGFSYVLSNFLRFSYGFLLFAPCSSWCFPMFSPYFCHVFPHVMRLSQKRAAGAAPSTWQSCRRTLRW